MRTYLNDITDPEAQRALIAYYDERGLDWVSIVAYHGAVFTGHWPPPKPERKGGRSKDFARH